MSSQNLVGRVAIVTGATSCVGGCTTRRLINMGMIVVGVSRKLPGTKRAGWGRFSQNVQRGFSRLVPRQKDDIVPSQEGQLGKVFFVRGDVTNPKDIRRIIKWTRKKFGHIDVLVNAAGSVQNYDFLYSDQKMLKEMIETRMLGTLLFSRAVILEMKAMKIENGHIIATSG
ncbi:Hypothetical predicted protein [Cloeon dipterum]|nr:Hypothetical predicted protein [Cloeon dipterum]